MEDHLRLGKTPPLYVLMKVSKGICEAKENWGCYPMEKMRPHPGPGASYTSPFSIECAEQDGCVAARQDNGMWFSVCKNFLKTLAANKLLAEVWGEEMPDVEQMLD